MSQLEHVSITHEAMSRPDFTHLHPVTSGFVIPHVVEKPWGKEEWIVVTPKYVMKFLHVHKGHSLSLQYHEEKMETLTVLEGECTITMGTLDNTNDHTFRKGMIVHLYPGTVHRFLATENLVLAEVSTPELWDVVRLEDKYGRK